MIAAIALFAACEPLAWNWPERMDFPVREASTKIDAPEDPDELRVLTWNIKFGGGRYDFWFDGWGDTVAITEDQVHDDMAGLRALIADLDPDVMFAQEVDEESKRTSYVDEVAELLDYGLFNYAAYVPIWKSAYIAEEGTGPVELGMAVLSKYPITRNTRIDLGPVEDQSALVRYFYLDRALQRTTIDLGSSTLEAFNNHPDAYSTDGTKERQIDESFDEEQTVEGDILIGGDFNAVPPGTINLTDFGDNAPLEGDIGVQVVTYEEEGDQLVADYYETYETNLPLSDYQAATSAEQQTPWFTHSIYEKVFWNRKIDYLFSNRAWSQGITVQAPGDGTDETPMQLSDHCPIFGVLEMR